MRKYKRKPIKEDDEDPVFLEDGDENWEVECVNCGELPTVHPTDLCGPCCFGESDTVGGNW